MTTKFILVVLVGLTSVVASATDYSVRPVNNCVYRGGSDSTYQQCVADYESRLREYNAFHSTSTGTRAPSAPTYSECSRTDPTTGTVSVDGDCRQRLDAAYQQELQRYNYIKQQEEAARREAAYQEQQLQASRQAAQEAEKKAKDGEKRALRSQILTAVASAVAFSQCPTNAAACAIGAFMATMSNRAGTQSGSFATAARQGCLAGNAYGSTQANCGPAPNPFSPTGFPNNTQPPLNTLVDNNGNCTATVEICNDLRNGLPPGTTLSDLAKGLNAFAGPKPVAKFDKDGNITLVNGKKFTPESLDSEAELKAAGLTGGQAAALMAAANKGSNGEGALAGTDVSGLNIDGGAGEEASNKSNAAAGLGNGEADGSEFDADKKRNVASAAEGLAKDFNGELIGVAGDDIFKMMNRRYVLKVKQDSFLAP